MKSCNFLSGPMAFPQPPPHVQRFDNKQFITNNLLLLPSFLLHCRAFYLLPCWPEQSCRALESQDKVTHHHQLCNNHREVEEPPPHYKLSYPGNWTRRLPLDTFVFVVNILAMIWRNKSQQSCCVQQVSLWTLLLHTQRCQRISERLQSETYLLFKVRSTDGDLLLKFLLLSLVLGLHLRLGFTLVGVQELHLLLQLLL